MYRTTLRSIRTARGRDLYDAEPMTQPGHGPRPATTIVITTYNRAGLVTRALDSALAQTYPNLRVVVVDDGSTDATETALRSYEDDPRVRIVRHDRNRGVTAAKNTGLDALPGDAVYFGILDSDDTLPPTALETLADAFEQRADRYSMIIGWCESVPPGTQTGFAPHLVDRTGEVSYEDVLAGRFTGEFWHIARHDLLGSMRFEERAAGAEGALWWRMLRARPGWVIPDVVRTYDTTGTDRVSIPAYSRRAATAMMWSRRALLDAVGADLKAKYPRIYGEWLGDVAKWAALAGDRATARPAARGAFRLAPSLRTTMLLVAAVAPTPIIDTVAWIVARRRSSDNA